MGMSIARIFRRLGQLRIHGGQRGDIHDGIPADVLPGLRPYIDAGEGARAAHQIPRPDSGHGADLRNEAGGGGKEHDNHAAHDHGRDKMRQIGGNLEKLLESPGVHLIAHQRQKNRQRKRHRDGVQADNQRVGDRVGEHVGVEIPLEVFQPCPGTAPDAHRRPEVLERDDYAVHGQIGEADKDHHGRKHQQIKAPVPSGSGQKRRPAHGSGSLHFLSSPFFFC